MKRMLLLLPLLMGIAGSCDEGVKNPDVGPAGTWLWVSSTGGIAGTTQTPASTGSTLTTEFTSAFDRIDRRNGAEETRHFHLEKASSIFQTDSTWLIVYNDNSMRQSYRIHGDSLELFDECYDCYTHTFIRVPVARE